MTIPDEILEIKERIIAAVPTEKLYLFGSYAYGTPDEDSDYDFYVVLPNDCGLRPIEAAQGVYRSLRGMKRKPIDVLAGTVERFEWRSRHFTLERDVVEKGVLLYEKS